MLALVRRPWVRPVAAIVAIGFLAVAWILVSPLFIRSTLVEPAPAASEAVVKRGSFNEIDSVHKGSGQALLSRPADGKLIVRLVDFSVTNGPDLYVYLSRHPSPANHDQVVDGINLGRLKASDGAFSYETDATANLDDFKSVVIYCQAFRTTFSIATLE